MSTPVEAEVVFNKMDGRLTFNKNDEDLVDTNHTSYNAIGGLSASGKGENLSCTFFVRKVKLQISTKFALV